MLLADHSFVGRFVVLNVQLLLRSKWKHPPAPPADYQ
jgi:hypothetical protein